MNRNQHPLKNIVRRLAIVTAIATPLLADAAEGPAAKFAGECSACHVAYPARFLPAKTWTRLMSSLDKHFGSDASLDEQTRREIESYLAANAGGREDPQSMRITDTRWFRREHTEEMDPAVFKSPKVKSASNCGACHLGVARGDYSEHNVRIPGRSFRHEDDD
jgi:nitrate/TMAO reductase-like tetraheme cytochrome c subunit